MIFEPRDSGDVTGTQGKKRVDADYFDFDTVSDWRRKHQTAWSMSGPSMPDPSYSCNSSHPTNAIFCSYYRSRGKSLVDYFDFPIFLRHGSPKLGPKISSVPLISVYCKKSPMSSGICYIGHDFLILRVNRCLEGSVCVSFLLLFITRRG